MVKPNTPNGRSWVSSQGSEPNARLLRRKERDASRGSPRSFTAQRALVQDDKQTDPLPNGPPNSYFLPGLRYKGCLGSRLYPLANDFYAHRAIAWYFRCDPRRVQSFSILFPWRRKTCFHLLSRGQLRGSGGRAQRAGLRGPARSSRPSGDG